MENEKASDREKRVRHEIKQMSTEQLLEEMLVDCSYQNRQDRAEKVLRYKLERMQLNILNKMQISTNILLAISIAAFIISIISLLKYCSIF